jgi:ABC-type nitrate/sulfonate/bicarbonate transport system substrate-binding protein
MTARKPWSYVAAFQSVVLALFFSLVTSPSYAADTLRVGKAGQTVFAFSLLELGVAEGIFKKNDLDIQSVFFDSGARLHQGMAAGAVDIGLGAGADMYLIAKGSPEKAVAVLAGPPLNIAVLVNAKSNIHTIADLKGQRIGISGFGSLVDWLAMELTLSQGWKLTDTTRVPLGSIQSMFSALLVRNVDVLVGTTELGDVLQAQGKIRTLLFFGDVIHDYITHVIFASDALIKNHPDDVRRFLKGWFETVQFMRTHKAETIRVTRKVTRLPQDIASKIYDEQLPMFSTDGKFPPKALAVMTKSYVDLKQLPTEPDAKTLIDDRFLP